MNNIIDELAFFLPIMTATFGIIVLFLKYRGKIPYRVNCWFCNQFTIVRFVDRNSWVCPTCEQYNGFNSDGNYNIEIPAQYTQSESQANIFTSSTLTNGLCATCNKNQQSKIQQLADFEPLKERYYDTEVTTYKNHLEGLYDLCTPCKSHVSKTLRQQESWFLSQNPLRLPTFSLGKSNATIIKNAIKKIDVFVKLCLLILAVKHLFAVLFLMDKLIEVFQHSIETVMHEMFNIINIISTSQTFSPYINGTDYFNNISVISNEITEFFITIHDYILTNVSLYVPNLTNWSIICDWNTMIGLSLQILHTVYDNKHLNQGIISSGLWLVASYLTWNTLPFEYEFALQIAVAFFILLFTLITIYTPTERTLTSSFVISDRTNTQSTSSTHSVKHPLTSTPIPPLAQHSTPFSLSDCDSVLTPLSRNLKKSAFTAFTHMFGEKPIICNAANIQLPTCNNIINTSVLKQSDNQQQVVHTNDDFIENLNGLQLGSKDISTGKTINPLFVCRKYSGSAPPDIFLARPSRILSPPRLRNVSHASWVAGGYWKPSKAVPMDAGISVGACLSRTSSQSSGFGSQISDNNHRPNHFKISTPFNSLPSSRDNSMCEEYDRFSALSEPAYHFNNSLKPKSQLVQPVYPILRGDQHTYVRPVNSEYAGWSTPKIQVARTVGHFAENNVRTDMTNFSGIKTNTSLYNADSQSVYNFTSFSHGLTMSYR